MSQSRDIQKRPSTSTEVDEFLEKVALAPRPSSTGNRGRLIFGMDATASREPMWDTACHIQSEMFSAAAAHGGLNIQLCYYRGFHEFFASSWTSASAQLLPIMTGTKCVGGLTQISRLLDHAIRESSGTRVNALVFVGDAVEENVDVLANKAGKMGIIGLPAFVFHEGYNPVAEQAFRQIATLSGGAYCRFDASSAQQLKDLLTAVAVYASGGRKALEDLGKKNRGVVAQLTYQMKGRK